jgi:N6-adenosine-specific RNA methylase IME4
LRSGCSVYPGAFLVNCLYTEMTMLFHDLASIFPLMAEEEYQALVRDIERNGLLEPIWLYEGKIIDGRNRYRACLELQITPEFRTWQGRGSPLAFVLSLNLSRRHLTSSQKAVVALEVEKHLASEARQQQGRRSDLLQKTAKSLRPLHAAQEAGKLVGTNRHYVVTAKQIKKAAPELIETVRSGKMTIPEARQLSRLPVEQRENVQALVEQGGAKNIKEGMRKVRLAGQVQAIEEMVLPKGKYHVLVADPPWPYTKRSSDTSHRGTIPYPSMTLADIEALDVGSLAHEDCILWLWTTNAFMAEAHQVARSWGFEVKTILTWAKDRMGLGDWLRGQTEHCLLAVKGRPVVRLSNQTTLLHGRVGEHSEKPEEFYYLVESLCPGSKCELFSRRRREGWNTFGAEVELFR